MPERVLVLHSYPPTPCLYPFEKGLREMGMEVFSVGPAGEYGDAKQFRNIEPNAPDYLPAAPDATIDDLFDLIGGQPDWLMYLYPNSAFLPKGLRDCPVPTVGWLTEEYKMADVDQRLYYYFDLAPTSFIEISEHYQSQGYDNRVCHNFITANWLMPEGETGDRPIDLSFIGTINPILSKQRCAHVERLNQLAVKGINVYVGSNIFLSEMLRIYTQSKMVWQHSGQGYNNLTYRISEAMCAGALVIAGRPRPVGGLYDHPLIEGKHIVYYDSFEEAEELIAHYARDEDARRDIAEAGRRYVLEEYPWREQIRRFVEEHVRTIPDDFLARRKARLERFGVDDRQEKLDYARYFVMTGSQPQVGMELIEQIDGWNEDAYTLSQHALAAVLAEKPLVYQQSYNAAYERRPANPLALQNHCELLFSQREVIGREKIVQALPGLIAQLQSVHPDNCVAEDFEGAYIPMGTGRFRIGVAQAYYDYPSGVERWRELHRIFLYRQYRNLGELSTELKRWTAAISAYQRSLQYFSDGLTMGDLADAYLKYGQQDKGIEWLEKACEDEPYYHEGRLKLGRLLTNIGRFDRVVELVGTWIHSYTQPNAERHQFQLLLANAYARAGNVDAAAMLVRIATRELRTGTIQTAFYQMKRPDNMLTTEQVQWFLQQFETVSRHLRVARSGSAT
ncbi:MAG: glycosyltransferase [Candidatus Poribacteria bacterium]|nr:glycosyltransferase [Candidatus Poribacteria bacterium]